jgi:KDO2-lipid IV(A) lauroyltransferase
LPRRFVLWGADRCSDVAFALARTHREPALANIRTVVGPDVAEDDVQRLVRAAFRASGRSAAELLWLQACGDAELAAKVRFVEGDWSRVDAALAGRRGAILLTAHLGAFDCLSQLFASRGYRVNAVLGRTMWRPKFEAAVALRRARGVNVHEASPGALRAMIGALRRNECVAFLGDRDFFENGTRVEFFGRVTTLPSGGVRLARETGASVVAGYLLRVGDGYELILDEPFTVERTADRQADVARGMERVVASLMRAIASAPGQWAVFQPVWSATSKVVDQDRNEAEMM